MGRARDARHRRRARAVGAARRRLRLLHALHRRVPDRRARRAGHARLDPLPLVLDAGARARSRSEYRAALGASRLRLRHLPGRLPVEPRRREAPRRPAARRRRRADRLARRVARGGRRRARRALRPALRARATIRAGCAGTRSSPRATSAAQPSAARSSSATRTATTTLLARARANGRSPGSTERERHDGRQARDLASSGSRSCRSRWSSSSIDRGDFPAGYEAAAWIDARAPRARGRRAARPRLLARPASATARAAERGRSTSCSSLRSMLVYAWEPGQPLRSLLFLVVARGGRSSSASRRAHRGALTRADAARAASVALERVRYRGAAPSRARRCA